MEKVEVGGKREEKDYLSSAVLLPTDCNGQGWATLKPGAWDSIEVCHMVAGTQILGSSSVAFTGASAGSLT